VTHTFRAVKDTITKSHQGLEPNTVSSCSEQFPCQPMTKLMWCQSQ